MRRSNEELGGLGQFGTDSLAAAASVTVNDYGTPDYNIDPHMQVLVAGRVVGEWDVTGSAQNYTVTLPGLPTFALLAESIDYLPFGEGIVLPPKFAQSIIRRGPD